MDGQCGRQLYRTARCGDIESTRWRSFGSFNCEYGGCLPRRDLDTGRDDPLSLRIREGHDEA